MLRALVASFALLALAGTAAAMPCVYGETPFPTGGYAVCVLGTLHQEAGSSDPSYHYRQVQDANVPVFVSDIETMGPVGVTTNVGAQQVDYATDYGYTYPGDAGGGSSHGRLTFVGVQGGVGTSSALGEAYTLGFQQNGVEGATYDDNGGTTYAQHFRSNATFLGLFMCDVSLRCEQVGFRQQQASYDDGSGTTSFDERWVGASAPGLSASLSESSGDGQPCKQTVEVEGFGPSTECAVPLPWVEDVPTFPPPPL
ncbi:MAG: hypothetical protein LC624_09160 [Halobacteriales archaeon]|nr:hypothetical protein [Halobacteriales archaeon]